MNPAGRTCLVALLHSVLVLMAFAADESSAPAAWSSLPLTGPVDNCPEVLINLMPEGMTIECAPYDVGRKTMMLSVDRWLHTMDENIEARGGWTNWKVGLGRLEPISGQRWTAWWLPKNERFVVRMSRWMDSATCDADFRSRGFDPPRTGITDLPLKIDYRLPSKRAIGFPAEARKVKRGGITAHRIRVAADGSVEAICLIFVLPEGLGFEEESREALEVTRFEPRLGAQTDDMLPAERIIVRTYTISGGSIGGLLWKVFIKPEKFLH